MKEGVFIYKCYNAYIGWTGKIIITDKAVCIPIETVEKHYHFLFEKSNKWHEHGSHTSRCPKAISGSQNPTVDLRLNYCGDLSTNSEYDDISAYIVRICSETLLK